MLPDEMGALDQPLLDHMSTFKEVLNGVQRNPSQVE
jgi:hypothetical protein